MCIGFYTTGIPLLDAVEYKSLDLRVRLRRSSQQETPIIFAVIDDKSLAIQGQWPWPRSTIAQVIHLLSRAGASVIALDIVFPEPKTDDVMLLEAIQTSRCPVVLGYLLSASSSMVGHQEKKGLNIKASGIYRHSCDLRDDAEFLPLQYNNFEAGLVDRTPVPVSAGYINLIPDTDGYDRYIPAVIEYYDKFMVPFSFVVAAHYLSGECSLNTTPKGNISATVGGTSIPIDVYGRLLVGYRGGDAKLPQISLSDILAGTISAKVCRGKIVIVGANAPSLGDLHCTAKEKHLPGMVVHGTVINNIIENNFLRTPPHLPASTIALMVVVGVGVSLIGCSAVGISRFFVRLTPMLIYIVVCFFVFTISGIVLPVIWPTISGAAVFLVLSVLSEIRLAR